MLAGERSQIYRVGIETEDGAELQQEPKVEIGEVALQGIKRQYGSLQPSISPSSFVWSFITRNSTSLIKSVIVFL